MSDIQNQILQVMEASSQRGKIMMTVKDLSKKIGVSQMKLKKDIRVLVESEKMSYWSSGSSNYIVLQDDFNRMKEKQVEN